MAVQQRVQQIALQAVMPGYLAIQRRRGDLLAQLLSGRVAENPYPRYGEMRARGVAQRSLAGCVVLGHAEADEIFRSKAWGSDPRRRSGFPAPDPVRVRDEELAGYADVGSSLLNLDPPDHTRLRALVARTFSQRAIDRLRAQAEKAADALLQSVSRTGVFDLVHDFAFRLPLTIVSDILGVPQDEQARIKQWGYDAAATLELIPAARQARRAQQADLDAARYFAHLIEARRSRPSDDLLSDLITVQTDGGTLSNGELLQTCALILVAGFITTVNLISTGALLLLQHPDQLRALTENPELIPNAVDEMLRVESPIQFTRRYALSDTVVDGVALAAGDTAILALGAANHDPRIFAQPDAFDIVRDNASRHLAFASGIHHCLGAALARMEGQIAFEALLRDGRMIALAGRPERRQLHNLRGLETLPVRLTTPGKSAR